MGKIAVHQFITLDGVIDEPTWTMDYPFDPKMGEAIAAGRRSCQRWQRRCPTWQRANRDRRPAPRSVLRAGIGQRSMGPIRRFAECHRSVRLI